MKGRRCERRDGKGHVGWGDEGVGVGSISYVDRVLDFNLFYSPKGRRFSNVL